MRRGRGSSSAFPTKSGTSDSLPIQPMPPRRSHLAHLVPGGGGHGRVSVALPLVGGLRHAGAARHEAARRHACATAAAPAPAGRGSTASMEAGMLHGLRGGGRRRARQRQGQRCTPHAALPRRRGQSSIAAVAPAGPRRRRAAGRTPPGSTRCPGLRHDWATGSGGAVCGRGVWAPRLGAHCRLPTARRRAAGAASSPQQPCLRPRHALAPPPHLYRRRHTCGEQSSGARLPSTPRGRTCGQRRRAGVEVSADGPARLPTACFCCRILHPLPWPGPPPAQLSSAHFSQVGRNEG